MHLHEVEKRSRFSEISFHQPWIGGYPFYHPSPDNHWKLRLKQQWMKSQRNLQRESIMFCSDWLTLQNRHDRISSVQLIFEADAIQLSYQISRLNQICFVRTEQNKNIYNLHQKYLLTSGSLVLVAWPRQPDWMLRAAVASDLLPPVSGGPAGSEKTL